VDTHLKREAWMTRTLHSLAAFAAVAALAFAGCGGDDESDSGGGGGEAQTPTETSGGETAPSGGGASTELEVGADAGGALKFDKTELEGKAGSVTITMPNPSSVPHAIAVEGNGVDEEGEVVQKDGTSTVTAELKAGEYEFYCPVPGHEEAGMKGTLTIK
jgi:plastocyanin